MKNIIFYTLVVLTIIIGSSYYATWFTEQPVVEVEQVTYDSDRFCDLNYIDCNES